MIKRKEIRHTVQDKESGMIRFDFVTQSPCVFMNVTLSDLINCKVMTAYNCFDTRTDQIGQKGNNFSVKSNCLLPGSSYRFMKGNYLSSKSSYRFMKSSYLDAKVTTNRRKVAANRRKVAANRREVDAFWQKVDEFHRKVAASFTEAAACFTENKHFNNHV